MATIQFDTDSFFALVLALAPSAIAVILFLAPMGVMETIKQRGSTLDLPAHPYTAMLVQCTLWCCYGIIQNENSLVIPNMIGIVCAVYYVVTYDLNCLSPAGQSTNTRLYFLGVLALFIPFAVAVFGGKEQARAACGTEAAAAAVIFYMAPLVALPVVFDTQSASALPMVPAWTQLLNGSFWAAAGFYSLHDPTVYLPSLVGVVAALVQLGCHLLFGSMDNKDI